MATDLGPVRATCEKKLNDDHDYLVDVLFSNDDEDDV